MTTKAKLEERILLLEKSLGAVMDHNHALQECLAGHALVLNNLNNMIVNVYRQQGMELHEVYLN